MNRTNNSGKLWRKAVIAGLLGLGVPALAQQGQLSLELPVDKFVYAQGLMKSKVYDHALKAFEKFIAENPDHALVPDAESDIITCLKCQEQYDAMLEAIGRFRQNRKGHRHIPVFTFWEGETYYQRGKYAEAIKCFESLLKAEDMNIREWSQLLLAQSLQKTGDKSTRPLELYELLASAELNSDHPLREQALASVARHYHNLQQFDKALGAFTRLADFQRGTPEIREDAMYRIGEIWYARQNFERARQSYDRFLGAFPDGRWSNEVRKRRAEASFQLKQYDSALKMIMEWRRRNPDVVDYGIDGLNGLCLYCLGEYVTAGPYFEVVVSNGDAPIEMRRYSLLRAIDCLLKDDKSVSWEKGLEYCVLYFKEYKEPGSESQVHELQGRLQNKLGNTESAVECFQKALALVPKAEYVRGDDLRKQLIRCYGDMKRWTDAAVLFRELARGESRPKYLLAAGEYELKSMPQSALAEKDFRTLLAEGGAAEKERRTALKRLLGIYCIRRDSENIHAVIQELLPASEGGERDSYEYLDSQALCNLKRYDEALAVLRRTVARGNFPDERRETDMRIMLFGLLQKRYSNGDMECRAEMVEQYRLLCAKDISLTAKSLRPAHHNQMAGLLAEVQKDTPSADGRRLLENAYQRAMSEGYTSVQAFSGAYHLAKMYLEPGDARYQACEAILRAMIGSLGRLAVSKEASDIEIKRTFAGMQPGDGQNQVEEFLTEVHSVLAECCFRQGKDSEALAEIETVRIRCGSRIDASYRRCLLVKAKICYRHRPQELKEALDALTGFLYVRRRPNETLDTGDEADAMTLKIKVLMDMHRLDAARAAYKELQIRYPERACQEESFRALDKAESRHSQP